MESMNSKLRRPGPASISSLVSSFACGSVNLGPGVEVECFLVTETRQKEKVPCRERQKI